MNHDEKVVKVFAAIKLRNDVDSRLHGPEFVREQILALVEIGFWNDSQIAEIVGYKRQSVSELAERSKVERLSKPLQAGRLDRRALDAILALQGQAVASTGVSGDLLSEVVATGTGTRLINALTGIPMGKILYQQRKLKKET